MNNLFSIPKMKLVVISASVLVVLSIIIVVVSCLNIEKEEDNAIDVMGTPQDVTEETVTEAEEPTESETEPPLPEDENGLAFERNGNSCTIIGIGTCKETKLDIPEKSPDGLTVTAIATGAFEGCEKIREISIPSTVKSIGTGAFVGCSSLSSFSVSPNNTEYCSVGSVLFSKDKTVLVCYPARRVGVNYLLSTNVTEISPYAFDGVVLLSKLLYRGTISQYQKIDIGTGNSIFIKMPIEFNYNAQKP